MFPLTAEKTVSRIWRLRRRAGSSESRPHVRRIKRQAANPAGRCNSPSERRTEIFPRRLNVCARCRCAQTQTRQAAQNARPIFRPFRRARRASSARPRARRRAAPAARISEPGCQSRPSADGTRKRKRRFRRSGRVLHGPPAAYDARTGHPGCSAQRRQSV